MIVVYSFFIIFTWSLGYSRSPDTWTLVYSFTEEKPSFQIFYVHLRRSGLYTLHMIGLMKWTILIIWKSQRQWNMPSGQQIITGSFLKFLLCLYSNKSRLGNILKTYWLWNQSFLRSCSFKTNIITFILIKLSGLSFKDNCNRNYVKV